MQNIPAVIIAGATASGKTAFAHAVIDRYFADAVIVSADSMQVYRGMDIGTAKPSAVERAKYRYRLIDCIDPHTDFSVADFTALASQEITAAGTPLFIVGGTGLYIRSLTHGMFEEPDDGGAVRARLTAEAAAQGIAHLYARLMDIDPALAGAISPAHERRIIRALEVYEKTGIPMSQMQASRAPRVALNALMLLLTVPRTTLYPRINERVSAMFSRGLIDEVRALTASGVSRTNTAMQGIGYKETIAHLNGEMSYQGLIDTVQMNTRRYAKRQETWFRRDDAVPVDPSSPASLDSAYDIVRKHFSR